MTPELTIPEMMKKMRSLLDQVEEAVWEDDAVVANELLDKCKSIIDAVEEYHGGF